MTHRRPILKGGKQSSSPGGTKTIDLRFGLAGDDEQDQAAMLEDMLADAEEEDNHRRFDDMNSPRNEKSDSDDRSELRAGGRAMDQKPSDLAAKYGVHDMGNGMITETEWNRSQVFRHLFSVVIDSDDDDDDDDFGADDESPVKHMPPAAQPTSKPGDTSFDFGPMAGLAGENSDLRRELDERRMQVLLQMLTGRAMLFLVVFFLCR